jgi:hypothetical protein
VTVGAQATQETEHPGCDHLALGPGPVGKTPGTLKTDTRLLAADLIELDQDAMRAAWMEECNPFAACANDWLLIDKLDPAFTKRHNARLDIINLEADVMDTRPMLSEITGDTAVITGGFYQFDFDVSDGQKCDNRFLIRDIFDMGYVQMKRITPKVESCLDILDNDGNVVDTFDCGHPASRCCLITVFYAMSSGRINWLP